MLPQPHLTGPVLGRSVGLEVISCILQSSCVLKSEVHREGMFSHVLYKQQRLNEGNFTICANVLISIVL